MWHLAYFNKVSPVRHLWRRVVAGLLGLMMATSIQSLLPQPARATATTGVFYVSPRSTSAPATGDSWENSFKELNQINWSLIGPGSAIVLDGGTTSKTYRTTLTIPANANVVIAVASEEGRSGMVVIDGAGTLPIGIDVQQVQQVAFYGLSSDGQLPRIRIQECRYYGLRVSPGLNRSASDDVVAEFQGLEFWGCGRESPYASILLQDSNRHVSFGKCTFAQTAHGLLIDQPNKGGTTVVYQCWFRGKFLPDSCSAGIFAPNAAGARIIAFRCALGPGLNRGIVMGNENLAGCGRRAANLTVQDCLLIDALKDNIKFASIPSTVDLIDTTSYIHPQRQFEGKPVNALNTMGGVPQGMSTGGAMVYGGNIPGTVQSGSTSSGSNWGKRVTGNIHALDLTLTSAPFFADTRLESLSLAQITALEIDGSTARHLDFAPPPGSAIATGAPRAQGTTIQDLIYGN